MPVTIRVRSNRLPAIGRTGIKTAARALMHDFSQQLVEGIRPEVPVDQGSLQESGHVEEPSADSRLVVFTGGSENWAGERRIYAAYVEWGTRFMDAQPYATPKVEEMFPDVVYELAPDYFENL